jgi:chromosomal replication initiation ATPase DnaA
LSFFSKRRAVAVRKYREFVEAGIRVKTPLGDATGSILGGRAFRESVHKLIRITSDKAGIPEIKKIEKKHEIKDIIKGVADYYGLQEDDLLKRSKKTEGQRRTGVYLSEVMSCRKNADIGVFFGITIQAVTNAVRDVEKRKEVDRRFNSELMRIKKIIGEPR